MWDFGGQFVFYSTHQMFLTDRGIYILITDMSQHIEDIVHDDMPYFDCSGIKRQKIEGNISLILQLFRSPMRTCVVNFIKIFTDIFVFGSLIRSQIVCQVHARNISLVFACVE